MVKNYDRKNNRNYKNNYYQKKYLMLTKIKHSSIILEVFEIYFLNI